MVDHVQKHHFALSEAPFYCSMCLFRCSTREALVKHVTDYRRHALMSAMQGGGDQSRFLIENPHPRVVKEGVDYEVTQQGCSDSGDLVSVKMTPQLLASLLNRGSNVSGEAVVPSPLAANLPYTPTRPEYNRCETSTAVTAEQDDVEQFEMLQELFPTPYPASSSPCLMPTFPAYQPTPVSANTTSVLGMGFPNYVPTPVSSSMVGCLPSFTTPAPAVPVSISRLSTPLLDEPRRLPVKTASTQTEAEPRREDSVLATALFQIERTLESSIGKLVSAVEWNSRAIKNLETTVRKQGESKRGNEDGSAEKEAKHVKK